jgi:hypothetical protein
MVSALWRIASSDDMRVLRQIHQSGARRLSLVWRAGDGTRNELMDSFENQSEGKPPIFLFRFSIGVTALAIAFSI